MDGLERRALFISYNGMLDPLGQSQVLPYLRELALRGVHFTLLSFERDSAFAPKGIRKLEALKHDLAQQNIEWHVLRYHQTPSIPATVYDVLAGIRVAKQLIAQNKIQLVHARSHIPATIAVALKKLCGIKIIFDVRGLMAEEYVEANHWQERSTAYRLTKVMEQRAFAAADGVVTLTEKIWPILREWDGLRGRQVVHEVIPCCADLRVFGFRSEDRERRRRELGLHDKLVLVYSGSIGGWYLTEEMADFFVALLARRHDAHFLWLTPGNADLIERIMKQRGLESLHYTVRKVLSADMSSYLSAADMGIAFYKPGLSKLATSPVKVTEYLACGLPVVLNAGIGDSDAILNDSGAGAIVSQFTVAEYDQAIAKIQAALDHVEATRKLSREVAERWFDLLSVGGERYLRMYERLLPVE